MNMWTECEIQIWFFLKQKKITFPKKSVIPIFDIVCDNADPLKTTILGHFSFWKEKNNVRPFLQTWKHIMTRFTLRPYQFYRESSVIRSSGCWFRRLSLDRCSCFFLARPGLSHDRVSFGFATFRTAAREYIFIEKTGRQQISRSVRYQLSAALNGRWCGRSTTGVWNVPAASKTSAGFTPPGRVAQKSGFTWTHY